MKSKDIISTANDTQAVGSTLISDDKVLQPLEWYTKEISRYYAYLKEEYKRLKVRQYAYLQHTISNTQLAYKLSKKGNFKDKFTSMKEYKEDYKKLQSDYLLMANSITKIELYKETLDILKEERRKVYESKSRN